MNKQFTMAALMAVLMSFVCPITGWTEEVAIDGIKYKLDDGKATVGDNRNSGIEGDLVIPSSVSYNGVDYPVTSIGSRAFYYCSSLTSVVIPSSVTSIEYGAFYGCSGLTSVVIPSSVTTIGYEAFKSCYSLTSVVIPSSVTTIGYGAFASCCSLPAIEVSPDNMNYISVDGVLYTKDGSVLLAFPAGKEETSFVIPEGVTSIRDYAFYDCSGLISVVIPEGVTSIGSWVFSFCDGLTSVVIPSSVTSIGTSAFYGCDGLTSVVIPEGVTRIWDWAFRDCSGLTSVVISSSVTSIGNITFGNCSSLPAIEVSPDNMNYISVDGVLYTKDRSELVAFPAGKEGASFVIPEGVTSIGSSAFFNCSGLTSLVIPEGVTSIGSSAFAHCYGLTSMVIPEGVTSIGVDAFSSSYYLTDLYFCSVTPPTNDGGYVICRNNSRATIHVPVGSKGAYELRSEYSDLTIVDDYTPNTLCFGETVSVVSGSSADIPVSLLNTTAITAFRFDLSLPSGVTLRKVQEGDTERYDVSLNDARADASHVVSVSMLSETVARVLVYSTGNVPFNGNDGVVLSVGVDVPTAVTSGEYTLRMENIELVTPEEREYQIPSVNGLLEVKCMGDVNGSGRVTISDVILVVNYLLGDTTTEIDFSAADLNGDGRISLGDVVGIINIILSGEGGGSNATARSMSESAEQTDDLFSVSLDRGDNRLLFSLDNATDYTAFQLDVTLPEGVSVSGAKVGSRASGHTIDWRVLSDGKVRVVVYSPTNALLKKGEGALFSLQLSAAGKLSVSFPVSVTDILLATPRGAEYKSRSLSEMLSIDDAVEEVRSGEPFTISVAEGVLQVHATEAARLPLYTVGGTLLRVLEVEVGLNTYEGLSQGVYLLNGHKVLVP